MGWAARACASLSSGRPRRPMAPAARGRRRPPRRGSGPARRALSSPRPTPLAREMGNAVRPALCPPELRPPAGGTFPLRWRPPTRESGRAYRALSSPRPTPLAREMGSAARPALCPQEKRPPAGDSPPSRRRPPPCRSGRASRALSSPRLTPLARERGSAARPALCPPENIRPSATCPLSDGAHPLVGADALAATCPCRGRHRSPVR